MERDYKIKDVEKVFNLPYIEDAIFSDTEWYEDYNEYEKKTIDIIVPSQQGVYQTQTLMRIFTTLENIDDDTYNAELSEYIEEWEYHVKPTIVERVEKILNLPENYHFGIGSNESGDVILYSIREQYTSDKNIKS